MALSRRVVLDTSAYSHLRAGHVALHERLDAAHEIILPTVVLGELHAAFRGGNRFLDNEATLARFLEEPFVTVRPVDAELATRYGEVFAQSLSGFGAYCFRVETTFPSKSQAWSDLHWDKTAGSTARSTP